MVENALKSLTSNGVILQRDAWVGEAEACERVQPAPAVGTCRAIVKCVHALNVDAQVGGGGRVWARGRLQAGRGLLPAYTACCGPAGRASGLANGWHVCLCVRSTGGGCGGSTRACCLADRLLHSDSDTTAALCGERRPGRGKGPLCITA